MDSEKSGVLKLFGHTKDYPEVGPLVVQIRVGWTSVVGVRSLVVGTGPCRGTRIASPALLTVGSCVSLESRDTKNGRSPRWTRGPGGLGRDWTRRRRRGRGGWKDILTRAPRTQVTFRSWFSLETRISKFSKKQNEKFFSRDPYPRFSE